MKKFSYLISLLLLSATAFANGPWQTMPQMIRLPKNGVTGQWIGQHYDWATPIVATTNQIATTTAQTNATILTITSFAHQPDYPRNITITPTGTTANNGTCTIVVSGTNLYGKAITENFANTATGSTAIVGAKAFGSVTSIVFPAACSAGAGVSWIAGVGSALGVDRCSDDAGDYIFSKFGGAYETTRGTFAVNATAVESNTFTPHGTMDGATAVKFYYLQNYRCYQN